MFFVVLPDDTEREHIWKIVIARHGRKTGDYVTAELTKSSDLFTGAEIEAVFIDALHEAYAENREPVVGDILEAIDNTVPLAKLMDAQITKLRQWAEGRARPTAGKSGGHGSPGKPSGKDPGNPSPNRRIAGLN